MKTTLGKNQSDIFDLTETQKAKLKALKKAYAACIKANMLPVNIYGSLTFYDKKYVSDYGNDSSGFDRNLSFECHGNSQTFNSFEIASQWSDDPHVILLTPLGKKEGDSIS